MAELEARYPEADVLLDSGGDNLTLSAAASKKYFIRTRHHATA